jgi:hypothetical protein
MVGKKNKKRKEAADTPPEPETLEDRVKAIHSQLTNKISTEANGLLEILGSRRRLMSVNFLAGLARGVGFFLGVTLIGALVLAMIAFFFNTAAERLGYKDITLEGAVRSAVAKFSQIQDIVGEAKAELEDAQDAHSGANPPGASTGAAGAQTAQDEPTDPAVPDAADPDPGEDDN